MPRTFRQRLFLTVFLTLLASFSVLARSSSGLHWEKIPVYNSAPTVVFAKLGLTHSTKNGHTRDGRQGVPDPNFPPGLTDVVPEDAERILLVRGTASGLQLFRARVTAADVPAVSLHLHAELQLRTEASETSGNVSVSSADQDSIADGVPAQISLSDGDTARVYQITERANSDGTLWIACRVSLPLPPATANVPIFVPERVWTDPISRKTRPGDTITFSDLAAVRRTAADKLGASGADTGKDYLLLITLTPTAPAASQP